MSERTTTLARTEPPGDSLSAETMELLLQNDLSRLNARQRVEYYLARCGAAGLDARTQPFQYITLQGKLTLYATKAATDQLCRVHGITTEITGRDRLDDIYLVTCKARAKDGRSTEDIGAVTIGNLKGDMLCNALMKATTKAKRRAVLSLCGLGMLDETETETVPQARPVQVDTTTGEILEAEVVPDSQGDRQATRQRVTQAVERQGSYAEAAGPPKSDLEKLTITLHSEWDAVFRPAIRADETCLALHEGGLTWEAIDRGIRLAVMNAAFKPKAPITTTKGWDERKLQAALGWLRKTQEDPEAVVGWVAEWASTLYPESKDPFADSPSVEPSQPAETANAYGRGA